MNEMMQIGRHKWYTRRGHEMINVGFSRSQVKVTQGRNGSQKNPFRQCFSRTVWQILAKRGSHI